MYCCPGCFSDRFLGPEIEASQERVGTCPSCGAPEVALVSAERLSEYFVPVADLYEPSASEEAAPLHQLIQEHWKIFRVDGYEALFAAIVAGIDVDLSTNYRARYRDDSALVDQWQGFSDELKHENRYFPTKAIDEEFLAFLLTNLYEKLAAGSVAYRARITTDQDMSQAGEADFRKPSPEYASGGRANPDGISYFYTASDEKTAVAEVRPQCGDKVAVATFEARQELRLVDLRNPYSTFTPFGHEGGLEDILFKGLPLLGHLGETLSRPVVKGSVTPFDYLPSQYLCEFIKKQGFDGIIYNSSLADGHNYVTFDDDYFVYREATDVEVERVDITFKHMTGF